MAKGEAPHGVSNMLWVITAFIPTSNISMPRRLSEPIAEGNILIRTGAADDEVATASR